uniref:Uncharacterized protein n=1 Tax=Polytomella parva TaxID=51329 RepID=A0A7S0YCV7_9CHLO|nr:Chain Y, B14.7 [Polytomella sp. Pringsheim 198.80]7ARD_Y Chain Y, B14.7 [Polytomella sp. Pringsheim 198.80]|eukprot:CAMPEP_0175051314 /NCGR_PEP_ID=MMETSP0052_2-20121109/7725_1 /TAXON_ID=51329 ORGANISM="Polytomella parva, Strain SAG 63-3" /NCGR_SAMPLE_ID=MMETSP0052_2 /ASSEMBLY_ACC=CAM_ASM_000194 /LENGTH=206 /DNA_ID=CAMNT_0016315573 /DNA_START=41 /DNA_END=661 /DNA_ORIENTATION=+
MTFNYVIPYGGSSSYTINNEPVKAEEVTVDFSKEPSASSLKLADKSDWIAYTFNNVPLMATVGLLAGAHEAFLHYERTPIYGKRTYNIIKKLAPIVINKTAYATLLGAIFCATDALYENYSGKKSYTSGMVAGAATGAVFAIGRPLPQPLVWPLVFAAAPVIADLFGEVYPESMKSARGYGTPYGFENLDDAVPTRNPIRRNPHHY